jgi:hypothetical protein
MFKADVIKHFGSQAATARFLGLKRAAVNKWPEVVPPGWAAQLHLRTRGKLRYDPDVYPTPPNHKPALHA